jgi:hypothetical protein
MSTRFGPWQYDERTGMVAVYSGKKLNCLDLPSEAFIYIRSWERKADGQGFLVIEEDCAIGRLVAAAPDMREALGAAAEVLELKSSDAGNAKALEVVRAAIAKADGTIARPQNDEAMRP